MERLRADDNWKQLEPEQRNLLLSEQKLTNSDMPEVKVQTIDEILSTLRTIPLELLKERVQNMKSRFDTVLERAAELLEPDTQFIPIPRPTMKTEEEIDTWAEEVKKTLKKALKNGPIRIQ